MTNNYYGRKRYLKYPDKAWLQIKKFMCPSKCISMKFKDTLNNEITYPENYLEENKTS